MKQSDQVRNVALANYVQPALAAGRLRFTVAVKDVLRDLVAGGFPSGNTPQVCTALRKETFLRDHGIEIESIDGPPSKMSTTVVYHYRVAGHPTQAKPNQATSSASTEAEETPEARARRLADGLRGLLKEEMDQFGGPEGFLRWVRGYDEEDAA